MEGHTCQAEQDDEEDDEIRHPTPTVLDPSKNKTQTLFQAPATVSVEEELIMAMVCNRFAQ
jgi:hypothetical protein